MTEKLKVVCFCGSSRLIAEQAVLRWDMEKTGVVTLGMNLLPAGHGFAEHHQAEVEGVHEILDRVHLAKIDMADEIFVVNVGGYIGDSTRREIEYARSHGKPVVFLERKE